MTDTINVGFVLKPAVICLPPIKRNQEHTHARTLTSLSFLSFHTLTSHSFHSTWFGHGSWIFHCRNIYVLLSHIVAMYICIVDLYLFSLRYFTWHILYNAIYISIHISWILLGTMQYIYSPLPYSSYVYICIDLYLFSLLHFTWHILYNEIYIYSHISRILLGGMNGPPHHKNQVSTLAMIHSILMYVAIPNHPIPAIVWNIFQHLIFGC